MVFTTAKKGKKLPAHFLFNALIPQTAICGPEHLAVVTVKTYSVIASSIGTASVYSLRLAVLQA